MTPTAYPLAWPNGRPRKTSHKAGQFRSGNSPLSLADAVRRVESEAAKIGATWLLISTNIQPTLSGRPDVNVRDVGVCVYFTLRGEQFAMACDTYSAVAQNLAAIAAHLDAVRAQERYGVATTAESLRAFSALPPPVAEPSKPHWTEVFGIMRTVATKESVNAMWRVKIKAAGQDPSAQAILNIARDEALKELS